MLEINSVLNVARYSKTITDDMSPVGWSASRSIRLCITCMVATGQFKPIQQNLAS